MRISYKHIPETSIKVVVALFLSLLAFDLGLAQDSASVPSEQLPSVQVQAPAAGGASRAARSEEGFGYGDPIPSGQPFSDFAPTRSEVVSATGQPQNIAAVPAAISVIENRGVTALGRTGLSDVVQGQPGVFSMGGFSGNAFDAPIAIRGFSNETTNRTSLLWDGANLNMPRTESNTNFIFPELIERVEVLRSDGTIPFGDKAIGGSINIILKKPRLNPGTYFGAEAGSWGQDREWAATNIIKDSLALGIFMGRYNEQGWRTYYGNNDYDEPISRPGPWSLMNVYGSLNWKISPNLTLDVSHLISDQNVPNYFGIDKDRWQRRDIRDIRADAYGYRAFDDPPEHRGDNFSMVKLFYTGENLGNLEITWAGRTYNRSIPFYFGWGSSSDQRWTDSSLYFKYTRTDRYSFLRNDLTLGLDYSSGRFVRESRIISSLPTWNYGLTHSGSTKVDRDLVGYWMMNQTRFWDRLILTLGYRIEDYDLKDLYSESIYSTGTVRGRINPNKSAAQYGLGFVYDRELGSDIYFKHSTPYRFPNFDDMINLGWGGWGSHPDPIWLLQPEDGTLEEVGIRHWFTRNIFVGATYYELDMNNEIYWGPDPDPAKGGKSRNINVPNVSHSGVEIESLIRITPRWKVKSNYTRQKVYFGHNWQTTDTLRRTTLDKWLSLNPSDMANVELIYDNREWGFSGMIAYHYVGSRFLLNDVFNEQPDLEASKWGDISFSQKFWDGLAELYFGVRNFSDRQYSPQGSYASYYTAPFDIQYYSAPGRTYFFGLKTKLDFDKMRMPTISDLTRMRQRLYGSVTDGFSSAQGAATWMRNLTTF
ncbi:MAG: TonB-dependent receptor [Desulfomonilaceae bacterium]|jgi:iron complex outermembrane receptor protein